MGLEHGGKIAATKERLAPNKSAEFERDGQQRHLMRPESAQTAIPARKYESEVRPVHCPDQLAISGQRLAGLHPQRWTTAQTAKKANHFQRAAKLAMERWVLVQVPSANQTGQALAHS